MPKISVIIPVYNVEKYLPQALESVINQTFSDLEIICVNDGSTDNSLKILEEYAQKDERIIVFSQKNQGVSSARNKGLDNAQGEYIMFLDPDDTYDLTLCEKVVDKIAIENPDIVMWGHNTVLKTEVKSQGCYIKNLRTLSKEKATLLDQLKIQVYVWDKAFKLSFIKNNEITFPIGIKNAEDLIFCIISYYCSPKYSFIPESLVNYSDGRYGAATQKFANCIKNDFDAYKFLCSSKIYQRQNIDIKIATTNHFLGGSIFYWRTVQDKEIKNQYSQDIKVFLDYIKKQFNTLELFEMSNYRKLKHLLFKYQNRKFISLFAVKKNLFLFGKNLTVREDKN